MAVKLRARLAAVPKKLPPAVREYMRAIGAKGGKSGAGAGARVRFDNMTADQRRALARKAAAARWQKPKKKKK
jgi:hypothetical protein